MKRRTIAGLLVGAVGIIVSVLALKSAEAQNSQETWEVEIDVFSGRPNPVFTLTDEELAQAKQRLSGAVTTAVNDQVPSAVRRPILGYRGIIIRRVQGTLGAQGASATGGSQGRAVGNQALPNLEVSRGKVLNRSSSSPELLDASNTGLEQYLITAAMNKSLLSETIGNAAIRSLP